MVYPPEASFGCIDWNIPKRKDSPVTKGWIFVHPPIRSRIIPKLHIRVATISCPFAPLWIRTIQGFDSLYVPWKHGISAVYSGFFFEGKEPKEGLVLQWYTLKQFIYQQTSTRPPPMKGIPLLERGRIVLFLSGEMDVIIWEELLLFFDEGLSIYYSTHSNHEHQLDFLGLRVSPPLRRCSFGKIHHFQPVKLTSFCWNQSLQS